ncbi:MAG: aldehyde dehydrogenase family protein, partial [Candidatus Puniceispirillaceae bacterium]
MELTKHYINGAFVAGENDRRLEVDDPADGQVFAEVALASQSDIDKAVAAARAAHDEGSLRKMRPVNRGRIVQEMGHYLLAHKEKFAALLARESGKPLWEAMIEIEGSARYFEYYGNQAETV